MDPISIGAILKLKALSDDPSITESIVSVLTHEDIIDWFRDHENLMESDENIIAFTLQERRAGDSYKTIQGFLNERTHRLVTARSIVSQRIDSKIAANHDTNAIVIYT